jgi:hypothetical protein
MKSAISRSAVRIFTTPQILREYERSVREMSAQQAA